jgi:hypothetical protein
LGRRVRLAVFASALLLGGSLATAPVPAAAAGSLQLLSSSEWGPDAAGSRHIVGEVKNIGAQASEFNRIDFNFYDASGTLLQPDFTYTAVDVLAPGELAPFDEIFTPPAGYDHYAIASTEASPASTPPNHNFATQITNRFTDAGGYQHIVGSVTNNNTGTDTFVKVVFTFYDCSARAVDADFTYISGSDPTLAGGATASFELIRPGSSPPYSAFAAMTQSPDAPSPYAIPARTVVASPPDAPTNVSAVAGDGAAQVRWTAPLCNGGSPITSYTVTSSPGGITTTAGGSADHVSIGGLTNATTYTFTVTPANIAGSGATSVPSNAVTPNPMTGATFYFAEGFTAFQENLWLLMPQQGGLAQIDYYTGSGHQPSVFVQLAAGHVLREDVNADVGPNQPVSARVELPYSGVAERTLNFSFGAWHGSTDVVGVSAPSTRWDFAEGSTLPFFSEYLTLQNPNASASVATLTYFTNTGLTPTRTLQLPPNSRTTVGVFDGDTSPGPTACSIDAGGNAVHCGVGGNVAGVSVEVASNPAIIAERPFYVNNFSFGAGPIRDGHDAFGAVAPGMVWNLAEGTTLGGFNEFLTLQNPNGLAATVDLRYFLDNGQHPIKTTVLPPTSRTTIEVFRGSQTYDNACSPAAGTCGVGGGIAGVSVQVTSRDQPIVAERPIYMVFNFGNGPVAGAHVAMGSTGLSTTFDFAYGSTIRGDSDFLTIQNPTLSQANITATYYTASGVVSKPIAVGPRSRHTVGLSDPVEGSGSGQTTGIHISSDQLILVEKPTYSVNPSTYGATDTVGYSTGWVATPAPPPPPISVNNNPWGYNFDNAPNVISSPPGNFCEYFACIPSFWNQTSGYVEECVDGDYSHSGGVSGSCSQHGGNLRPLYLPY